MRTPARSRSYFHFRRGGRNQGAKPLSVLIWISAARYWPAPAATIRSLHAVLPSAGRLGCVDRHVWELQVACFVRVLVPGCSQVLQSGRPYGAAPVGFSFICATETNAVARRSHVR